MSIFEISLIFNLYDMKMIFLTDGNNQSTFPRIDPRLDVDMSGPAWERKIFSTKYLELFLCETILNTHIFTKFTSVQFTHKEQPPIVQNQPGPCSSDVTKACFSMMTKEGSSSTFESTPRKKDWKLLPWRGGDACCCVSLCSDCQQGNHNWDNKGHKPEDFRGMGPVYLG